MNYMKMDTKENIPQQNYTFINATLNLAHHQPQVKYHFASDKCDLWH